MLRAVGASREPVAALAAAYPGRLLHLAARDLTGVAPSTRRPRNWPTSRPRARGRARRRRAELPPPRRALAVVAMGKCGGRELNYASDVDVIFVAEAVPPPVAQPADETAALRHRSRLAAGMIGVCARTTRRQHLPRRPEPPARGPQRPAGPHPGQPPRVLRALGEDLGVPGAAEGAAGAGDLALARRTPTRSARWSGKRPTASTSSKTSRRCAAGWSSRCPPGRPDASSSWPRRPAGHRVRRPATPARARPHRRVAARARHPARARRARRRRLRRPRRRQGTGRRLPVPAPHRAPAAAAQAEPHSHPARGSRRTSPARQGDGTNPDRPSRGSPPGHAESVRPRSRVRAPWRRHALQVRRLHEKLFYRPLLNAVARLPRTRPG